MDLETCSLHEALQYLKAQGYSRVHDETISEGHAPYTILYLPQHQEEAPNARTQAECGYGLIECKTKEDMEQIGASIYCGGLYAGLAYFKDGCNLGYTNLTEEHSNRIPPATQLLEKGPRMLYPDREVRKGKPYTGLSICEKGKQIEAACIVGGLHPECGEHTCIVEAENLPELQAAAYALSDIPLFVVAWDHEETRVAVVSTARFAFCCMLASGKTERVIDHCDYQLQASFQIRQWKSVWT